MKKETSALGLGGVRDKHHSLRSKKVGQWSYGTLSIRLLSRHSCMIRDTVRSGRPTYSSLLFTYMYTYDLLSGLYIPLRERLYDDS